MKPSYRLVLLFAVLNLLPIWLIEPRYYINILILFLLLRKPQQAFVEKLMIVNFLIWSIALTFGIQQGLWFL